MGFRTIAIYIGTTVIAVSLGLAAPNIIGCQPRDHADQQADQDLGVQGHSGWLVRRVIVKVGGQLAFVIIRRYPFVIILAHLSGSFDLRVLAAKGLSKNPRITASEKMG
jgi:Na+/H+-dicarboxylate symporter